MRPVILFAVFLYLLTGCKKPKEENWLCDGRGSESYWPLAPGNSWNYSNGETDSLVAHWDSIYVMRVSTGMVTEFDTLRVAPNGDIYLTAPGYAENLYLPADLPLGKQWTGNFPAQGIKDTLTVIDENWVITSASCVYVSCVKVEVKWHFANNTTKTDYRYYAKGVGNVYREFQTGSTTTTATLNGITLN